jgi:hypothetical protein
MYTKYYLVIPFQTLGIDHLPVRSLKASRFCRFHVDVIEVLRTSILPHTRWYVLVLLEFELGKGFSCA